jgi:hypothetical protein
MNCIQKALMCAMVSGIAYYVNPLYEPGDFLNPNAVYQKRTQQHGTVYLASYAGICASAIGLFCSRKKSE